MQARRVSDGFGYSRNVGSICEYMQVRKVLDMLVENMTTPGEKEALLTHLEYAKNLSLDMITRVWRDKNNVLCVGYANGSWFHYDGKGEWY